jgi:hypothetical protein
MWKGEPPSFQLHPPAQEADAMEHLKHLHKRQPRGIHKNLPICQKNSLFLSCYLPTSGNMVH